RRQGLALAARRDDDHLVIGEVLDLLRRDQKPIWRRRDPKVACDVEVLAHRTADEGDTLVEADGGVDHLLDAVDVGGEAGDDHTACAASESLEQRRSYARLRR